MSTAECLHFIFKGRNYMVPETFVTKEHPGGKSVLLPLMNGDITEAFEDSDHSQDAREMLEEWCVDVSPNEKALLLERAEVRRAAEEEWRWRSTAIAFSVAAVVAAVVMRKSSCTRTVQRLALKRLGYTRAADIPPQASGLYVCFMRQRRTHTEPPIRLYRLYDCALTMVSTGATCVRVKYKSSNYLVPLDFILRAHPGGQRLILPYVNQDITRAFVEAKHSEVAIQLLEQWMEGGAAFFMSVDAAASAGLQSEGEPTTERWPPSTVAHAPSSALWNAFVYGVAGATAMAAFLCRQ